VSWLGSIVAGARRLVRRAEGERRPDEPVVVFSTWVSAEAHLLKWLLDSHGIAAEVRDRLTMIYGELPPTPQNLPSVWVAARDAPRADEIVRDFQSGRVANGEAWRCAACGETVGAQFTACGRCGVSRPEQPGA
jgi:hypothetical protein